MVTAAMNKWGVVGQDIFVGVGKSATSFNLERIRGYNSINFREGYQMTEIRTPKEIFKDEDGN